MFLCVADAGHAVLPLLSLARPLPVFYSNPFPHLYLPCVLSRVSPFPSLLVYVMEAALQLPYCATVVSFPLVDTVVLDLSEGLQVLISSEEFDCPPRIVSFKEYWPVLALL